MIDAPTTSIQTLGIFGAGKSGIAIARRALAAGYNVQITTSGPLNRTTLVTQILTPGAIPVTAAEMIDSADALVLAIPLRRWRELPLPLFEDRLVIDVMNYWRPVDGYIHEFETDSRPTSEIIREALPANAHFAKTLNHIGYHEIEELAAPPGTRDRVALGIATDDSNTLSSVSSLVDDLGFDPVPTGPLRRSQILQPGAEPFGANLTKPHFEDAIARNHSGLARSTL